MSNIFYDLGKFIGQSGRKANWIVQSLTAGDGESIEAEFQVGRDLANAFAKEAEVDADPEVQRFLDQIALRLIECVADERRQFAFCAVHKEELNAFAMPGGFIFVTRRLLELCDWDADEIAFVLGHEMGHVIARHAIRQMMASSMIRAGLARIPVGGLLGVGIMQSVTTLLDQGYSQDQELEADNMGVKLVNFAGFDTDGAKRLLIRLNGVPEQGWQGSAYFSSHPPINMRIERIDRFLRQKDNRKD